MDTKQIRADLAPDPQGAVKVRALAWQDRTDILGLHDAESPIGWWYNITETPEGLFQYEGDPALENPGPLLRFHTLEEAKAAAQKDYEQRIRSALEPCDPMGDARVKALVEALQNLVTLDGMNTTAMMEQEGIDRARAALAALSPTGGEDE